MPGPSGPEWVDFEEFDTAEPVNDSLPEDCFAREVTGYLAAGYGVSGEWSFDPASATSAPPSTVQARNSHITGHIDPPLPAHQPQIRRSRQVRHTHHVVNRRAHQRLKANAAFR